MQAEQNKAIIRRYYELHNEHNLDGAFATFSPDILSHAVPGTEGPQRIDAIKHFFTLQARAIPDLQVTVHDLIAEADRVAVRFSVTGTQTGELMGEPPTNQPVEWQIFSIYRLVDGQIAEVWSS